MQRQYTGNVTRHLALKTGLWLKTYTSLKMQFMKNFIKIFQDKKQKRKTGHVSKTI